MARTITPKTTPARPTYAVGTRVTLDNDEEGVITLVRRRKFSKRYQVELNNGVSFLARRDQFNVR